MSYLVWYTESTNGGTTNGPLIRINPKYKCDRGLLEHEKVHVRQWCRTLGIHSILYFFSKTYRGWSEAKAFKTQLSYYPHKLDKLAEFLTKDYGLGITIEYAKELILK